MDRKEVRKLKIHGMIRPVLAVSPDPELIAFLPCYSSYPRLLRGPRN